MGSSWATFGVQFGCIWELRSLKPLSHENQSFAGLAGSEFVYLGCVFPRAVSERTFLCFLRFRSLFEGPSGRQLGSTFRDFFRSGHVGHPRVLLGSPNWSFGEPFEGLRCQIWGLLGSFGATLKIHHSSAIVVNDFVNLGIGSIPGNIHQSSQIPRDI